MDQTSIIEQLQQQIAALSAQFQTQQTQQQQGTRSPIWKPLEDMRNPTSERDRLNRPTFLWSAEPDDEGRKPYQFRPFPTLLWSPDGREERTVKTQQQKDQLLAQGWQDLPPVVGTDEERRQLADELNSLSPEERKQIEDAIREDRMNRLKARLSALHSSEVDGMLGTSDPGDETDPTAAPRKRGRPRKAVTDGDRL